MALTGPPKGCGPSIGSIYYNLCDLTAVWGVVVEAVAATGVVTSFVLFVILMACLPFVTDKARKGMVALQAGVLVFTLGLFGLAFAFVVGRYSTSCVARRFLFGVLFSGCLACLVMHGLWLVLLQRRGRGPKSWMLCLGALALWLVEVIINTEWLIITVIRNPPDGVDAEPSCRFANQDFVMALIYVMVLMLAAVVIAVTSLTHKRERWRRDAAFILVTGIFTSAIWAAWIGMYVGGNRALGDAGWDDPTLAVAVVSNAWVFLLLYAVPEICLLTRPDPDLEPPHDGDHIYPARSLVYDNIHKEPEPPHQTLYMENKAFTMEEPPTAPSKPVSPYGAYNGQLRSCVYQPTEIALIAKGLTKMDQDTMMRRASTSSLNAGVSNSSSLDRSMASLAS
ncbi:G-protein coupled receptor family C group 5 member C-like [Corythoichthys intestinalis]|uniref:G-protein coupled receptor family C group 5 member C-like n=1 Tax=Corythoichthys intestinalis TaxID=161448 RepID=UPI0025A513CB|nr:G-protein coupled receptor family C group 5 member C-like [Corythoichthys intestinalis]XP_057717062.1 G-protein coupled receptor family C group 5 member C-like [Corythoichthys intestinalis]XP_057717063.1 G-protein coupled receptor family C group 5 member C-like [Corythoichthys intestinalis]XP_057717064.1 G-protein coupled receptor family C group 5 member C-like [Corythoichthys intestinalis]XP_057717065.1 G-protein coupled receptor family C group 5 member C-like [Corythoichthys intestinalis]